MENQVHSCAIIRYWKFILKKVQLSFSQPVPGFPLYLWVNTHTEPKHHWAFLVPASVDLAEFMRSMLSRQDCASLFMLIQSRWKFTRNRLGGLCPSSAQWYLIVSANSRGLRDIQISDRTLFLVTSVRAFLEVIGICFGGLNKEDLWSFRIGMTKAPPH